MTDGSQRSFRREKPSTSGTSGKRNLAPATPAAAYTPIPAPYKVPETAEDTHIHSAQPIFLFEDTPL